MCPALLVALAGDNRHQTVDPVGDHFEREVEHGPVREHHLNAECASDSRGVWSQHQRGGAGVSFRVGVDQRGGRRGAYRIH